MKTLLIITLALSSALAAAQNGTAKIDSLNRLIAEKEQAKPDSALVALLIKAGDVYLYNYTDSADYYYTKALSLCEKLNLESDKYRILNRQAVILNHKGKFAEALPIVLQILEYAKKINNETWITQMTHNIANSYYYQGDYPKALEYYLQLVSFYEQKNQKYEVANVITNIEALYTKMKQYDKALAYGEKAIEIMADKPDSTLRESVLINHASALYHLHRYSEAEAIYHEALRIGKNNNVLSTQSAALTGLGVIYLEKKDYITSEKYHEEAAKIFEQSGDWHGKCLAVSNIAVCETYLKNYAKAYKLHLQALAIAEQHNYPELAHNRYGDIAHLELLLNQDVEKCEYYLAKADSIEAVLRNEEVVKATAELEVRYETEKKELQLAEQKAVISREKFVREALIGGLGLTAIVLVLLWRLLRLRNKRNRALAERNDALDEMNATKDRFFTIISHDLKNPAVAQRDAIQMLLQNADKWDANALSSYYYELLKSADDQVELLYNLLNWARVQTGRMEYRPDTFDFVHKLRSEYALADKMAQQKGVGFATDMPETAIVVGDANMLAAVVRNLLTNAVKFTPKGGSVTLTIAAIDNASSLRVSVADTGTGMDAGALQNLFRIDSHTSTLGTAGEQGTGLGLAVCKEFLEKHGSTLHVESEPGRGSTFWFELAAGE